MNKLSTVFFLFVATILLATAHAKYRSLEDTQVETTHMKPEPRPEIPMMKSGVKHFRIVCMRGFQYYRGTHMITPVLINNGSDVGYTPTCGPNTTINGEELKHEK